jgi:hypothetical protein
VVKVTAFCAVAILMVAALLRAAPGVTETRLAVPGARNEHVSLAAAGNTVAATWGVTSAGGQTAIYAATSDDAGRTFSRPVRVAASADVGGEQPPRVVLVPAGKTAPDVVIVWTAKSNDGTRLLTSRSRDGGRTFSVPALVAGSAAAGNRGWESVAVDAGGHPVVAWLDHREAAASSGGHHHGGVEEEEAAEQSVARAATSRLYVGSTDGGVPVQGLVHGVCYCCKTAIATAPDGALMVAWRHVYPHGYRDIAFSQSRDSGRTFSTPVRVSSDAWQLAGCPEDGPALAIDAQRRAHVVWPTLLRENGREVMALFYAMTTNGTTFSPRTRLPAGDSAFHPQLAVTANGELVGAWDEGSSGTRHVRLARGRIDESGQVRFTAAGDFRPAGDHPALAVTPDGVIVAWASGDGDKSELQVVRLPL